MEIVFELPFYNPYVGGVAETIKIARRLGAKVRFQKKSKYDIDIDIPFSVGTPNIGFPKCDACVTYSDNPFLDLIIRNKHIGKKFIYMLSYGMSPQIERYNALNKNVKTLCSTKKIEAAIINDGGTVNRVGFALDMQDMWDDMSIKGFNAAIYYHPMESKNYPMAVEVVNALYGMRHINGVYSFGTEEKYFSARKPINLIEHYPNANREEIRSLFNRSKIFINPSVSEGLNLTPVEATLCGCPSIICDGAVDELFINGHTCFVAEKGDFNDIINNAVKVLSSDYAMYREVFRDNMKEIIKEYTWSNLITNFKNALEC